RAPRWPCTRILCGWAAYTAAAITKNASKRSIMAQYKPANSNPDYKLPDKVSAREAMEGFRRFLKWENRIHRGSKSVQLDRAVHLLEHRCAAHANAVQGSAFHHQRYRIVLCSRATEEADKRNFSAKRNRLIGAVKCARAANFDDVIRATSASQPV